MLIEVNAHKIFIKHRIKFHVLNTWTRKHVDSMSWSEIWQNFTYF